MNTVVQLFPDNRQGEPPVREVRVADCDDGYTKIANELLEAAMSADLTVRQLKIVLAVIRKTYGFNKKTDRITNTQIASMTGIHHTHICKAKNELLERNILVMTGREIGVNKVVSCWKSDISQVSKTLADVANKTLAKSANTNVPSQLNTKDTLKDNKEKEILKDITPSAKKYVSKKQDTNPAKQTITDLDYSSWPAMPSEQVMTDWKAMRQAKGKKAAITQTVIITIGKQLAIAAQHGLSVDDCLSECCTRNWQGFKAEWMVESLKQKPAAKQPIRQNGFTHTGEPSCTVGKI
jgi:phage replication O-like protein O